MFTHRRAFFTETGLSQGIYVTVDATGYVVPCGAAGHAVGMVEQAGGNLDGSYDPETTSALPVTVILFRPTMRSGMTGLTGSALSPGSYVYYAAGGLLSPTGTITAGLTLEVGYNNNDLVEVAWISN